MDATARTLIESLGLSPHPEGGWYRELHRSAHGVRRDADAAPRSGLTVIAFLLPRGEISRWHRVAGADEVWLHAAGAPLQLHHQDPHTGRSQRLGLGPFDPAGGDQLPMRVIPAGHWQAARSTGDWTLVHCCVGPGFAFEDFSLLRDLPRQEWPDGLDPDLI
ncbi:MAG: cupin domain-containing protein [Cyanobium sp. LacPavin_0818_WC50_MAG_67_9]|nr:cupin domain-containing protein [Cyanobium sp. LacPavin_0818_WC50_MAG_67_9]